MFLLTIITIEAGACSASFKQKAFKTLKKAKAAYAKAFNKAFYSDPFVKEQWNGPWPKPLSGKELVPPRKDIHLTCTLVLNNGTTMRFDIREISNTK